MTTNDVLVGVVTDAPEARATLVLAVEAAGATAMMCTEATAIAGGAAVDAIVFDVGATPERFVHVATALAQDARTQHVPRVLIVAGDTSAERIAPFGPAVIVPSSAPPGAVSAAVSAAVTQVRRSMDTTRRLQKMTAERRDNAQNLTRLREGAGTLSHDARVLFGVILGYASNLRDGIAGPVNELQRTHAVNIVEASTDAAALLERYALTVRRATPEGASAQEAEDSSARQPPRRRQTDLGELVRTTVILLGGVAAAKQIRLTSDVARGVFPAWCDAMQIKQALVNLLSNALKFTPAGGSVEVAVRPGPPASARGGATARREIELVVTDSGPGIPPAERERVFERGARLERDRQSPGTGIGLSVVRDVVEQHGGAVRIEDVPGGGASFVLTLPTDLRSRASDRPRAMLRDACEDSE